MTVRFQDLENNLNPHNGQTLGSNPEIEALLADLDLTTPFVCQFDGENGYSLTVGVSRNVGWVQHAPSDGDVPYLMAVAETAATQDAHVEFMCGGTPTPIARRYRLPFDTMKAVVSYFVVTGNRSPDVEWKEI